MNSSDEPAVTRWLLRSLHSSGESFITICAKVCHDRCPRCWSRDRRGCGCCLWCSPRLGLIDPCWCSLMANRKLQLIYLLLLPSAPVTEAQHHLVNYHHLGRVCLSSSQNEFTVSVLNLPYPAVCLKETYYAFKFLFFFSYLSGRFIGSHACKRSWKIIRSKSAAKGAPLSPKKHCLKRLVGIKFMTSHYVTMSHVCIIYV